MALSLLLLVSSLDAFFGSLLLLMMCSCWCAPDLLVEVFICVMINGVVLCCMVVVIGGIAVGGIIVVTKSNRGNTGVELVHGIKLLVGVLIRLNGLRIHVQNNTWRIRIRRDCGRGHDNHTV